MDVLLLPPRDDERWHDALTVHLARTRPGVRVRRADEVLAAPAGVELALVWTAPPPLLAALPDLRCVMALGAGIDGLLPLVPEGVTLTRLVDASLAASMREYVLFHVLRYHRAMDAYEADGARQHWQPRPYPPASARTVGVLGLGELGRSVASALAGLGFRVLGLRRGAAEGRDGDAGAEGGALAGVRCLNGEAGEAEILAESEILVCLLPLTDETRDYFDAQRVARMRPGAQLINVARGAHVVDEVLLAALDAGHLSAATLDVFRQEPLPPEHPFWRHPKVTVTPHVASLTNLDAVAAQLADNVCRYAEGRPLLHVVDRARGY